MSNQNKLGFGKDVDSNAQPIGISGEENNELIVFSLEQMVLFTKILKELKKFNEQLEIITQTKLTMKDAHSYRDKL